MTNILLLNWNSVDLIIERLTELDNILAEIRVIIINNDDSALSIEELSMYCRKEIHVVNNFANLGYAGGNNKGYIYLSENKLGGDIIIANPDVSLTQSAIDTLIFAKSMDNFGAAMTAAHDEFGIQLYDFIELNGFKQRWIVNKNKEEKCLTSYIAGSLFIVSRDVINKIGLFDERYFLYWEEVDLSLRIKHLGKNLYSFPKVSIQRDRNSIDRIVRSQYYLIRNSFILKKKFESDFSNIGHSMYLCHMFLVAFKLSLKVKSKSPFVNFFNGLKDGKKI
ncbi:TPA: glycosyltransferase family 2 protein [Vibrio alginolyticus]